MTATAEAEIVSFAERLKQRREELGMSQAQAARELDVARTAYRLWEMEAAKPQPDRWRLISRWLGVSVTTMLLADEPDDDVQTTARAAEAFERAGLVWDDLRTSPADFFAAAHELIQQGTEKGFLSTDHAQDLTTTFNRIEEEQAGAGSETWQPARLYRELKPDAHAPRAAREATAFVATDLPAATLDDAHLLVSELVTNSIKHGQQRGTIGLLIDVNRERLRVEVTDTTNGTPKLGAPYDTGGYGLALVDQLATRWDTKRLKRGNLTWFELDLPQPGTKPKRQ